MGLLAGKSVAVVSTDKDIGEAFRTVFTAEGASVEVANLANTRSAAPRREVEQLLQSSARPDIVVNAALDWRALPLDADAEEWEMLLSRNLSFARELGTWAMQRLPENGVLCSLGMVWSMPTSPALGMLGASRAGLATLTKAWALQGAPRKVRAVLLSLGTIDCSGTRTTLGEAGLDAFVQRTAMGRAGEVTEVARPAAFLCSNRARHINGVTVVVDGGLLHA